MFGSKISGSGAFTCTPSVAEGVLNSAERGGYRQGPETRCNDPRPEKSTLGTRSTSGRPAQRRDTAYWVYPNQLAWRCPSPPPPRAYAGLVTPSDASGHRPPD